MRGDERLPDYATYSGFGLLPNRIRIYSNGEIYLSFDNPIPRPVFSCRYRYDLMGHFPAIEDVRTFPSRHEVLLGGDPKSDDFVAAPCLRLQCTRTHSMSGAVPIALIDISRRDMTNIVVFERDAGADVRLVGSMVYAVVKGVLGARRAPYLHAITSAYDDTALRGMWGIVQRDCDAASAPATARDKWFTGVCCTKSKERYLCHELTSAQAQDVLDRAADDDEMDADYVRAAQDTIEHGLPRQARWLHARAVAAGLCPAQPTGDGE